MTRRILLNVNVGERVPWRTTGRRDWFVDVEHYVRLAQIAERGGIDAIFLADGPGLRKDPRVGAQRALEPFVLLSAIAAATSRIGLIASASTTYASPLDVAEKVLGLDLVSNGRAGWNVVTTYDPVVAGNFGLDGNPPRAQRYERAGEFVDVVRALWSGRPVDHRGPRFPLVSAPLLPPSPQGEPVLFQAGGSPPGVALAGRIADAVFTAEAGTVADGRATREALRQAARRHGRAADALVVLPGISTVIGGTEQEAWARYHAAGPRIDLVRLGAFLGVDLREFPLDAPLRLDLDRLATPPDGFTGSVGFRASLLAYVAANRPTLRQLALRFARFASHQVLVGAPEQVAAQLLEWFDGGAADGFNLMPDRDPDGLSEFVDQVVPLLRRRGAFPAEYGEQTLRGRLEAANRQPTEALR